MRCSSAHHQRVPAAGRGRRRAAPAGEDALAQDSRFEEGPRIYEMGDAATAIEGATHGLEGSIEIGGQEHFYLEGQAAAALPQEGGDMVVYSSSQHPTEIQHKVAEAFRPFATEDAVHIPAEINLFQARRPE